MWPGGVRLRLPSSFVLRAIRMYIYGEESSFPSVEALVSLYTYLNVSRMYLHLDTYLDVSRSPQYPLSTSRARPCLLCTRAVVGA